MKILLFNELYHPNKCGGAEISTQLLAEGLVKLGHEVHVCTSTDTEKEVLINEVNIHFIKQANIYWSYTHDAIPTYKKIFWHLLDSHNYFNERRINKVIEKINPDIIHTNVISGFSCIIWKCAKKHNIPIVHTLRDYYLMCVRATMFHKNKNCSNQCIFCKVTSIAKNKMSKYVNAIVGISSFILNKHLEKGYFENALIQKVIPNSVRKQEAPNQEIRPKIIGYLGRISPSKGIELLINSFLSLNNEEYTLHIAGDGDPKYHNYLKEKYNLPNIIFNGRVNANTFLKNISLLVVPSLWHEPFGRVVIEALAAKCPVFVSNRGGMPELIQDNNGRVFNLEQKDSLTNLLKEFIEKRIILDPSLNENLYSENTIAEEYERIYKNIKI